MEDPLTWMIYKCKISSSQENLLDRSLFAFESQEGLITPLTQQESSSRPDDIPVGNTGILICSPPDGSSSDESSSEEEDKKDENNPLVEEYHTPLEERGLDELTAADDVYRDADAVRFVQCVDDVEKPCDNEESRVKVEGIGESQSNLHTDEDLGLGLGFIEGLNESPNKNLTESPKNLSLDTELSSEEDSVGDVAEKTLESLVNKNLGFLKCNQENLPVIAIRKDIEEVNEATIDAREVREESEAARKRHRIAISSPVRTGNAFDDHVLPDSSKDVVMNDLPLADMETNAVKEIVLNSQPNNSSEDVIVAVPRCVEDVEMEDLPSTAPAKDIGKVVDKVTLAGNETNGRVSGFENPLTDEVHNDDNESGIKSADEVEKSECADSTVFSPGPLRNSPALWRLPNWAERESNSASEDVRHGDDTELVKKLRDIGHFMANLQKPVGDDPEEEDILEIATKAGLNIPRPRWWRPEGYET